MNPKIAIAAARLAVVRLTDRSWAVQGRSEFSYVVRQSPWTLELQCPCVAGQHGNQCRHIAAVLMDTKPHTAAPQASRK